MAELTEYEKESYNIYITEGIDEPTANKLATGELSAADYKTLQSKKPVDTEESLISNAGYNVELIDKTKKEVKEKRLRTNNSAAADDYSGESFMFQEYNPSKKDIINSYGIDTDTKNELPKEVRFALSMGLNNESLQIQDAKKLYINEYLIEDKGYSKEEVDKYSDKIEFKYQELKDSNVGAGDEKTKVFTYRVPVELGGTGKWSTTNAPTLLPTGGDMSAIAGDLVTVSSAVAGGIGGSFATPILGTAVGSAGATFTSELSQLIIGRYVYGLGESVDEVEWMKAATLEAALTAGIDLVATPAFLLVGQGLKKAILTAAKDKITESSIKNLIKSGAKLDQGVLKNLEEARAILKDAGMDEKLADDYLVANVQKVFPESGISVPATKTTGYMAVDAEKTLAQKAIIASDVENKLIKLTSGLDDVNITAGQKDDIINRISSEIKDIRTNDIKIAQQVVDEAEGKVIKLRPLNTDPTINEIDNMGLTFNEINVKIKPALSKLERETTDLAKKSNIRYNLDIKDTRKVLNDILEKFDVQLFKKMKAPTKDSSKEYIKAYKKEDTKKVLLQRISGFVEQKEIVQTMKELKAGLRNIDDMTYKEAMSWKSIIAAASENQALPGQTRNALRKVKGDFNTAIRDGLTKDPELLIKHNEYDNLLSNYRKTFIEKLADDMAYSSTNPQILQEVGTVGTGRNVFEAFTDGSNKSLIQAEKLSNLLNTKGVISTAQKNKINNSLYNNYFNKVVKDKKTLRSGDLEREHNNFIAKYGKNYELILGKKAYQKFASSQANALKVMDDAVQKQIEVSNAVSKSLPAMNVSVIDSGSDGAIVKQILSKMKSNNVSGLVRNLNKTIEGKSVLNDVRKVMVYDFIDQTKVNGLHDGKLLNKFLDDNGDALTQLFNKEFVQTYRSIAKALTTLQDDTFLGVGAGRKTLTEVANQAGLFIDIVAGPLNHNRLIVNRLARIFDMFNLGGDNLGLLLDYKMFIEAAKKNAFGGNYNVMLDVLGSSNKPIHQGLMKRFLNAIGIGKKDQNYKGLTYKTLLAKEYVKDKTSGNENDLSEPDVFTVVDKVLDRLGKGAKHDVVKRTKIAIMKFIKGLEKTGIIKDKDYEKERLEKEFNKKLKN
jgi:uncharacterized protein (UPF0254 family)